VPELVAAPPDAAAAARATHDDRWIEHGRVARVHADAAAAVVLGALGEVPPGPAVRCQLALEPVHGCAAAVVEAAEDAWRGAAGV
jgi:hypothetical protein